MTDLEHKTASAWDHIRQCGSKAGKVTIFGRGYARLAGTYLQAFLAGEEVL